MLPLTHVVYVALFGLAVLVLYQAQAFPGPQSPRDIGPAVFPLWLAGVMIALILADVVISRRRIRWTRFGDVGLAVGCVLLLSAAVYAASQFGFFYVLPVALFVGLWLSGSRRLLANGLFSLALPAILWVLFDQVLLIPIGEM